LELGVSFNLKKAVNHEGHEVHEVKIGENIKTNIRPKDESRNLNFAFVLLGVLGELGGE